ncbi:single Ig IL-1-related receptor isoform X4 [Rhinolophus sinicus]|uniref:single Ig IL-1-related receptor isoform X4 n=1 Tax=Rhinolophus sinicus TaxID=89399 RepID=UPI003D78F201
MKVPGVWAHCPTLGHHGSPGAGEGQPRAPPSPCVRYSEGCCAGIREAASAQCCLWPKLHVNSSCSCLTCSLGMVAASDPSWHPDSPTTRTESEFCLALGVQSAWLRSPWSQGWHRAQPARGGPGQTMAGVCDRTPDFLSPSGNQVLGPALGSVASLNCTAWVVSGPHCPLPSVQWLKDGLPLNNGSHYDLHEASWVKANLSEVLVSSVLGINLTSAEDYGAFTCSVQNVSSFSFILWRAGPVSHLAAVLASLLVLLVLLLAALFYVKCRLNVLLWYQDTYGEVEVNDGKLYDAYVSYSDSPEDRKFVNFILKPQLERCRGYKLFLDDRDLLPRAEPSADLLVNLSRCRRLIVVLSDAFLGRAWCSHSFRRLPPIFGRSSSWHCPGRYSTERWKGTPRPACRMTRTLCWLCEAAFQRVVPWTRSSTPTPRGTWVSEGLSSGSRQLHHVQVGSRSERAGVARWTSRTLAPATTAPARTSTAWCPRTTCSPLPPPVSEPQDARDN